jgi:single-strand DNA-binding protein
MNRVDLTGRLVRDPEVRYSQGGSSVASFTVAVDRTVKKGDEWVHEADFIKCVAFGKSAEFIEKYFKKGSFIVVTGSIKTGNYEKEDGTKVFTTDIWVEKAEFGGSKAENVDSAGGNKDGFMDIPDGIDEEVPFA